MNTNILQKCVDELKKEDFKKDYVLGLLEAVIEMNKINKETPITIHETKTPITRTETVADEDIPDFLRPGPVGVIKN